LAAQSLAVLAVRVYISPDAPPLVDSTVLIESDKIVAIGRNIPIPKNARILRSKGCSVCAGFWNTHINFVEPKWNDAASMPAARLTTRCKRCSPIRELVKHFNDLGGQLMFGTDTGFLRDYDLKEEYRQLFLCGFSARQVLAMLTTIPSRRFGVSELKGKVAVGMEGDLTILANGCKFGSVCPEVS
jgi:imidazolonepropionase-like amidohydrolase